MKIGGVLLAVAGVLFLLMPLAQSYYGLSDFRFGANVKLYTESYVKARAAEEEKKRKYVTRILFSLDFPFLICFGLGLLLLSISYAQTIGIVAPGLMFLILLPMLYMMADGGENILVARMLTRSLPINDETLALARFLTLTKLTAAGAAIVQLLTVIIQAKVMRAPVT